MRIAIVAVGTQGDIQPALVLGRGLQEAGHDVRFATAAYYHQLALESGLVPIDLGSPDPRQTMAQVQAQTVAASRFRRYARIFQSTEAPLPHLRQRMVECCAGVDLVLANYALVRHAAEALDTRHIGFGVTPVHETREFPHPLSRLNVRLGPWTNLASHRVVQRLFWRRELHWVNTWRAELGLPGENVWAKRRRFQTAPFLYGISPSVLPRPNDWPSSVRLTGYWFARDDTAWQPADALMQFLRSGPPPVAVGFGSLVDPDLATLRQILSDAFRAAGVRGLILGGWSAGVPAPNDNQCYHTDWVPFQWLLPRVSALVHHAGSGTCALALRAAVPSVCVAYSGEQWFWAGRLQSLGVSAGRIARRKLSAEVLAHAIRQAHHDPTLRSNVRRLSASIVQENGVATAVAAVEELAAAFPSN